MNRNIYIIFFLFATFPLSAELEKLRSLLEEPLKDSKTMETVGTVIANHIYSSHTFLKRARVSREVRQDAIQTTRERWKKGWSDLKNATERLAERCPGFTSYLIELYQEHGAILDALLNHNQKLAFKNEALQAFYRFHFEYSTGKYFRTLTIDQFEKARDQLRREMAPDITRRIITCHVN